MKIQYCSDLHLEFDHNDKFLRNKPLTINGDILILAGDIIPLNDKFLSNPFFRFVSDNYKKVFWIPGNHEFYHNDITEYSHSYNIKISANIDIVNNLEITYENIRFVFSTLWSKISYSNEKMIETSVSDFECISKKDKKFKAADFNKLHIESLNFIKQSLEKKNSKTVVVTHHLPSSFCNSALHNNSPINEAFCVDLSEYIDGCNANFWIYGHSHFNQKPIYLGKTVLLTNQLGYVHYNEHEKFSHKAYFSI